MKTPARLLFCCLALISGALHAASVAPDAPDARPLVSTWMCFIHWDRQFREIYGRSLPVAEVMERLAEAGVTDVYVTHQMRPGSFLDRHSPVPSGRVPDDRDLLEEMLSEAARHNLRVWLLQTPKWMTAEFISDTLLSLYPGLRLSLINEGFQQFFRDMIDAVAEHYGHHPSLAGFSWHEINEVATGQLRGDPDVIPDFKAFALERYGEEYPGERIPAADPENVWWPRFYRYHMARSSAFVAGMAEHARRHGLRSDFTFYNPERATSESWTWGYDILALEQSMDMIWFAARNDLGRCYYSIRGIWGDLGPSYRGQNLPLNFSYSFHGLPLGFWEGKRPLWLDPADSYTSTQKGYELFFGRELFPRWLALVTLWQGGVSPARAAVAIHPHPFIMRHPFAPGIIMRAKVEEPIAALSQFIDLDGMVTGSLAMPENLARYRSILVPEGMGVGLDAASYRRYYDYVLDGGTLLVVNSPVTITRDDLSDARDMTAALCGVTLLETGLPGFVALESDSLTVPDGKLWGAVTEVDLAGAEALVWQRHTREPILTRHRLGRGGVYFLAVSAHRDLAVLMAGILQETGGGAVRLSDSTGMVLRQTVLKDCVLAVTLWGQGTARLHVDAPALGMEGDLFTARDAVTGGIIAEDIEAVQLAQGLAVDIAHENQLLLVVIGTAEQTAPFTGLVEGVDAFAALGQQAAPLVENPEVPIDVPRGDGARVGVYYNGIGAEPIMTVLREEGFRVFSLPRLDAHAFRQADVVIIPQVRGGPMALFTQAIDALRDFVEGGGGVLLTHDAVGYRGHETAFPEIGRGHLNPISIERVFDQVEVTGTHPASAGLEKGDVFRHAFFDHITLSMGEDGQALLVNERAEPVVAVGRFGRGRAVLNGMLPGYASVERGSRQAVDREPEGGERTLLLDNVRWLAGDAE